MDKDLKEEKTASAEPKVKFEMPVPETPSAEAPEKASGKPAKETLPKTPATPPTETTPTVETTIKPAVETSKAAPEDGGVSQQTPSLKTGPNQESPQVTTWTPEEEETGGSKKILLIVLIVVAVAALIGGGVFVYLKARPSKEKVEPTPMATPIPLPKEPAEISPTPSPVAELKRENLLVQVLNGSGVPGTAGKAKAFLEGLGYQGVKAENANSYDYEKTEVSIKEDKKDYLDLLLKDLEDEYSLATETGTLEEESEFDAVVIIGKE